MWCGLDDYKDNYEIESVGKIIQSMIRRRSGLNYQLKKQEIFLRWNDIAGDQLVDKLFPLHIKGKVLYVGAVSSSWAQEAGFFKRRLLNNISRVIGENIVEEIRVEIRSSSNLSSEINDISRAADNNKADKPNFDGYQPDLSDASDVHQMLEQLKQADESLKEWRQQQGWPVCKQCDQVIPPNWSQKDQEDEDLCPICARNREFDKMPSVRQIIRQAPWMNPYQLMAETGAAFEICQQVRTQMENFLRARIVECVGEAKENDNDVPEDFRRRVMQLLMLVKQTANPSLRQSTVERECGPAAANLFFSDTHEK